MKIQKIVSGVLAVLHAGKRGTVSALAADTEAAGISVRVQGPGRHFPGRRVQR